MGKEMDMFQLERDFNVSAWAYGQPGIAERQMVCSLLGGRGVARLVTEEPSLSRRSPTLQSKMGIWPWTSMALGGLHPSSVAAGKMSLVFKSGYLKEDGNGNMSQNPNEIYTGCVGRLEEMSIQTPDTSIDEDAVYLEVVQEVKGLGRAPAGPPKVAINIVEGANGKTRTNADRQDGTPEETREMQDRLARMEALLMQHLGIRPHVPPTLRTPPSPLTERSGPQSDDHPGHLTTEIAPSQSVHPHDHRPGHWTSPYRRMSEDQRHLLDDHDKFMKQLMPPPRPPPRQEIWMGHAFLAPEFVWWLSSIDIVTANAPDESANVNAPDDTTVPVILTQLINDPPIQDNYAKSPPYLLQQGVPAVATHNDEASPSQVRKKAKKKD
ncbi:hypothetical protein Syun_022648 [Stephania yunnanensis]|uniref:Uncharacterized protein n=1 Tax=Stephania yunnanensis TaxID=152371 RepID=A0AAP0FEW6_9MAGN